MVSSGFGSGSGIGAVGEGRVVVAVSSILTDRTRLDRKIQKFIKVAASS